ncbi:DUF4352 domain-containing protein [Alkalicoccobacillus gibsonii]|uniref:DUF4352 domain-containing protein n=1 Tax=Alkalicoccobacillus gibsonii TaxID=79881 RepID=UPI0035126D59
MRGLLKIAFTGFLTLGLFVGCSNAENNTEEVNEASGLESTEESSNENEGSGLIEREEIFKENDDEEESGNEPNLGDGETEDQTDLSIGDTAKIETTISEYEVTLDAVEFMDELEGEAVQSQFDTLVLADVTIKNLSEESIDISDSMGIFEITTSIESSGYPDVAAHFSGVDKFSGKLNPNEEASGQMLFEEINGEHHYLRVTPGLTASNAVKNEATWVFEEEDGK